MRMNAPLVRAWPTSLAVALLIGLGALGAAPSPSPTAAPTGKGGDVDAGKALYANFCQKCHGAQGEGVPRMYALVDAKIVHLGSKQAQAKSDAEIKKAMLEGLGKMEAVEDLTPQQADKILAFERTLHQ